MYKRYEPAREAAQHFLERDTNNALAALGALLYEPLEELIGVRDDQGLAALAIIVAGEPNIPDAIPTISLCASDPAALTGLLDSGAWPEQATWVLNSVANRHVVENWLGYCHNPAGGMIYFGTSSPVALQNNPARQLGAGDTTLDLSPCSLSAIALSFWLMRGWRVFGVVEHNALIGHALAAYPIGNTEEVAAVFTTPSARRRGVASRCVAAAINDICSRGKRALYVSRRNNHASIAVAQGLGLEQLFQTWEIEQRTT